MRGRSRSRADSIGASGRVHAHQRPVSFSSGEHGHETREHEWRVLNHLELKDEADIVYLCKTLAEIRKEVPHLHKPGHSARGLGQPAHDLSHAFVSLPEQNASEGAAAELEYTFDGPVTPVKAFEIIGVVREGDRQLSEKAFMHLLREAGKHLKAQPTVQRVVVAPGARCTVVGDLHGQIEDLLHIIDVCGAPEQNLSYVFNGDFVDRGNTSVEILTVLFALACAFPDNVYLNRGNHEDGDVCSMYGFAKECKSKYSGAAFHLVCKVFRCLPIATVINDAVLVLHGGIDGAKFSVAELEDAPRFDWELHPQCEPVEKRPAKVRSMITGAIWSDPRCQKGVGQSERGAGVEFGPDVCARAMKSNKLELIIRSHELIDSGFAWPYERASAANRHLLCTLFSASNYCNSKNKGAIVVLKRAGQMAGVSSRNLQAEASASGSEFKVPNTELTFTVHHYSNNESQHSLDHHVSSTLCEAVASKRDALMATFLQEDKKKTGLVSRELWAEIMQDVIGITMDWEQVMHKVVPLEAISPVEDTIDYNLFLTDPRVMTMFSELDDAPEGMIDALYEQRFLLEALFDFFDEDGTGEISLENFRHGFDLINEKMPPGKSIGSPDHLLSIMDVDHKGNINLNQFFETFRLVESSEFQSASHKDSSTDRAALVDKYGVRSRRHSSLASSIDSNSVCSECAIM